MPIFQTNTCHLTGDCLSACLASILEVSPKTVPKFLEEDPKHFWPNVGLWCWQAHRKVLHTQQKFVSIPGYSILNYLTEQDPYTNRKIGHAIVAFNGKPVHCPSYGKLDKWWWWTKPSRVYLTITLQSYDEYLASL